MGAVGALRPQNLFPIFYHYLYVLESELVLVLGFILAAIMGFGLFVFGRMLKQPYLIVFSGFVWLFASVAIFPELGAGWAILGLGLALILLYDGGSKIVDQTY